MENQEEIIYDKWIPCTEETYWQTEDFDIVFFKCADEDYLSTRRECTYGWNVLCKLGAFIMTLSNPYNLNSKIGYV